MYTQCKLRQDSTYQITYIPDQLATKGRQLRLKTENGWDGGWVVEEVYSSIDDKTALLMYANHKRWEEILKPHRSCF